MPSFSPENTIYENFLVARDGKFSLVKLQEDELAHTVFYILAKKKNGEEPDDEEVGAIARLAARAMKEGQPAFFRNHAGFVRISFGPSGATQSMCSLLCCTNSSAISES